MVQKIVPISKQTLKKLNKKLQKNDKKRLLVEQTFKKKKLFIHTFYKLGDCVKMQTVAEQKVQHMQLQIRYS